MTRKRTAQEPFPNPTPAGPLFTRSRIKLAVNGCGILLFVPGVLTVFSYILTISGYIKTADITLNTVQLSIVSAAIGTIVFTLTPILLTLSDTVVVAHGLSKDVTNIYNKVSLMSEAYVPVVDHSSTNVVASIIAEYDNSTVFLGFADDSLLHQLLRVFEACTGGWQLYINHAVLLDSGPKVRELLVQLAYAAKNQVFVIDCPPDSCTIFAHSEGKQHCTIVRHVPGETTCWSARIEPGSGYAKNLYNSYKQCYATKGYARLNSRSKAWFLYELYETRNRENRQINSNIMVFKSRSEEYEFAARCVKSAQKTIWAVDYMSLDEWKSLSAYAAAHKRDGKSKLKKTRIHFYRELPEDKFQREKFQQNYAQYIQGQTRLGVDLFFLRADFACEMEIYNGFLVIDDEVVFTSEETQKREEAGRVDFNSKTVDDFILKFKMLLPEECHNTLTKEQFEASFMSKVPRLVDVNGKPTLAASGSDSL